MYLPADSRYSRQTPQQFMQMLNSNIYPVQMTDPNCIFHLDEGEFQFDMLDATFKPDIAMRISRTPLLPNDPQTYSSLSKFVEYNLRKYRSTLGNTNQNQLSKPLKHPPEMVGVKADGRMEVLPLGCAINPLSADPFKDVHLTPGCLTSIVDYDAVEQWQSRTREQEKNNIMKYNARGNDSLDAAIESNKTNHTNLHHQLKTPGTSLAHSGSNFMGRSLCCDGLSKKITNAKKILIGCHGRVFNMIILNDDPGKIDVDPPAVKIYIKQSCMTCMDTFPYIKDNGEKNLDVLIGFVSGDILWVNPIKQKYCRWNKNGRLKSSPVTSLEWSKCGSFAIAGFADGDVMIFDRNLEDEEKYGTITKNPVFKDRYMRAYRMLSPQDEDDSLKDDELSKTKKHNPIAHYKLSKKAIVDMTTHPEYHNIVAMACDDGFVRIFDLLKERLTDLQESYFSGFLSVSFTGDGKYLLAGGEDDLASIYEFQGSSVLSTSKTGLIKQVARLQGSESWIRDISVDSHRSISGILYRVGSAGDDGAIRFYEFQPRNLPKVKKLIRGKVNGKSVRNSMVSPNKYSSSPDRDSSPHSPNVNSMRKVLSKTHGPQDSISSMSSDKHNRRTLLSMIGHGSATSLQTLQYEQQQQIETSFDDQYVRTNPLFSDHRLPCLKTSTGETGPEYHSAMGLKDLPIVYPICEKKVGLGRMYSLYFEKDFVWAFLMTGDLIRWRRP